MGVRLAREAHSAPSMRSKPCLLSTSSTPSIRRIASLPSLVSPRALPACYVTMYGLTAEKRRFCGMDILQV